MYIVISDETTEDKRACDFRIETVVRTVTEARELQAEYLVHQGLLLNIYKLVPVEDLERKLKLQCNRPVLLHYKH